MTDVAAPAILQTVFSPCRRWRYTLVRSLVGREVVEGSLDDQACPSCGDPYYRCQVPEVCLEERLPRQVMFVCLNPSTADEHVDDPTVRRCMAFAKRWLFEQVVVCNLYGWRSTDPRGLSAAADPIGPDNDYWLGVVAAQSEMVVAAWGVGGARGGRGYQVAARLRRMGELNVLGLTRGRQVKGRWVEPQPRHPLYVRGTLEPKPW